MNIFVAGINMMNYKAILKNPAVYITGIYLTVSLIWIATSGKVAFLLAPSQTSLATIELIKGGLFVVISSTIIFLLILQSNRLRSEHENRIQRLNRVYAVLSHINGAILRIRDHDHLLKEVCNIATVHGDYLAICICQKNRDTDAFEVIATAGAAIQMSAIPFDTYCIPGYQSALQEGKSIVFNNLQIITTTATNKELLSYGIRSYAILPLIIGSKLIGSVNFYSSEINNFDTEEIHLLEEMAADTALGLEVIEKTSQISYLSFFDTLTGLPNRTLFKDRIDQALSRCKHVSTRTVAVVLIDLTTFRRTTDRFGRYAGDLILNSVASGITILLRPGDTVARLDSHYFGILLNDLATKDDVACVVNRLVENLPMQILFDDVHIPLAYSCGVAIKTSAHEDATELIRAATVALTESNKKGNVVQYYSENIGTAKQRSKMIELGLMKSIDRGELELYYQPIVNISSNELHGCEALLRWNSKEYGSISPAEFIPIAEETGFIITLGEWVCEQACKQIIKWNSQGLAISISVNVSAVQLRTNNFAQKISDIFSKYEIDLSINPVALEITESVMIENLDIVIPVVEFLKSIGFQIHLDDFGTGYSSLSYLSKIAVGILKIDKSFIRNITENGEDLVLVKGILGMAKGLRLKVIAEGVETRSQLDLLKNAGCDYVQGYLFSRPVKPDELARIDLHKI